MATSANSGAQSHLRVRICHAAVQPAAKETAYIGTAGEERSAVRPATNPETAAAADEGKVGTNNNREPDISERPREKS